MARLATPACWGAALAAALTILALAPAAAFAATYYARSHGGSIASCALGDECSLPHAVSLAADGDSVVLEPGPIYTPSAKVLVKHAIEIGGVPGAARPTIQGPEEEGAMELTDGADLHDANLVASEAFETLEVDGASAERIEVEATGPETRACLLFDATLVDSVCRSEDGPAVAMAGANASFTAQLRNVTAISSGGDGISVLRPGHPFESRLEAVNVIARGGPGAVDVAAFADPGEGGARVILTSSDYATTQATGAEGFVTPAGTGGNITAPPSFVNEAAGDLHQLPGSPTIDAGSTDPSVAALDLDGNPRALAAHPTCASVAGPTDIGAYELVPPPLLCPAPRPPLSPVSPLPPRPGTKLGRVKIEADAGSAKFSFSGRGSVSGFACELVRPAPPQGMKKGKRKKPRFGGCSSPKTYRHLSAGRYTFKVEAMGLGGADATPAVRRFRI
jgi:hypothetical protein